MRSTEGLGASTQEAAAAEGEVRHAAELVEWVVQLRGQRAARRGQLLAQMLRGRLQHGARNVAIRVLIMREFSVSCVPCAMPSNCCSMGSMCSHCCTQRCPQGIKWRGRPGQCAAATANIWPTVTVEQDVLMYHQACARSSAAEVPHLLQEVGDGAVQQDAEAVRVAQQLPEVAVSHGPAAPRLRHPLQCAAAAALRLRAFPQ